MAIWRIAFAKALFESIYNNYDIRFNISGFISLVLNIVI